MTYLLYKYIGDSSTSNRSNVELLAVTSLLWVPTVLISIIIFNIAIKVTESALIVMDIGYFRKNNIVPISNLNDLIDNIEAFVFIGWFAIILVFSSFIVSTAIPILSEYVTDFINAVRVKKGNAKLTSGASVWQLFFVANNDTRQQINGESPMIVEISYLDDPGHVIYGSLKYYSADGNHKKFFYLAAEEEWTAFFEEFKDSKGKSIPYTGTFFDGDTKVTIREINQAELFSMMEEDTNE
ncbi:hypothetical protein ACDX78_05315 [Virgibacillus oceani]